MTPTGEKVVISRVADIQLGKSAWDALNNFNRVLNNMRDNEQRRPRKSFHAEGACSASPGFKESFEKKAKSMWLRKMTRAQIVQRLTALQLAGSYGICFLDVLRKSIVDRMTLEQFWAVFPDDEAGGGDDLERGAFIFLHYPT